MTDVEKKKLEEQEAEKVAAKAAADAKGNDPTGQKIASDKELQVLQEATKEMRDLTDRADTERKEFGEVLGETTAKMEKANTRLDTIEENINKKFAEFDKRMNRKRIYEGETDKGARAKHEATNLFFKFMHSAVAVEIGFAGFAERRAKYAEEYNALLKENVGLDEMQLKVLSVGDNTLGGFNAPPEFVQELIVDMQEQNPVRALFTSRTTTSKSIQVPRQTGFLTADWVAELGTRSETTGILFGREEIPAHELHAQVNVSREDVEDSFFNMESFVRAQLVEQFARAEGVAFVSGSGVGRPTGYLNDSAVTGVTSDISANFEADDLIALFYELLEPYVANSTWVMQRNTIRIIRQMKDGNGQYLWSAGISADARPATILDRPYVAADAMPAVGASAVVAMFGDFRTAYTVVDRIAMEIITDIFSSKATGTVEFSARKRTGGQVIVAQALKSLTTGA